jgi:hypothetical protein
MKIKTKSFSAELTTRIANDGQPIDLLQISSSRYEGDPEACICCGKPIDTNTAIPVVIGNVGRLSIIPWGEENRLANLGCYFFGSACAKKIPARFKGNPGSLCD